jgi:putative lipoic acid-binding regulatory protein
MKLELNNDFPCQVTIKVFGLAQDAFEVAVYNIILKHYPNLAENAIYTRLSRKGKYLAMTITVEASSKEQLDSLYLELSLCQHVLMAL